MSKSWKKENLFLKFFPKTEAGHVLQIFLHFWLISASRSYKLGSYKKKKRVYVTMSVGPSVTQLFCTVLSNLKVE